MGIKERLDKLEAQVDGSTKAKVKKMKIPAKGKVSNMKMRKGYATVITLGENKNVDFRREIITDGTIKLNDTFHAVEGEDVFFYKGKPVIIQCKNKLNPYNPFKGKHETYGQKYVMARMEGDKLSLRKKFGWGLSIGVIAIIAIIGYSVLTGA